MRLSILIPTWNSAADLPCLFRPLQGAWRGEWIVCDGGSSDGTVALAEAAGARVFRARRGRGPQLIEAASHATGDWLLFLHADTVLAEGWRAAAAAFAADPGNMSRAAYFRFALDDGSPAARRLERLVAWRCRAFGLPYGDQGLLIARHFYLRLGGYRDWPLMEDVDLVRRIGRANLTALPVTATTSARRYRRAGYWRQSLRNLVLLALYFLKVPPRWLAKIYR